jgi:hypothetical protein
MQPETPAETDAPDRLAADPTRVDHYTRLFLQHSDDHVAYWANIAVLLTGLIEDIWDAHAGHCHEPCKTCDAVREAIAAYDAFEAAERARCTCSVGGGGVDHFTTDCGPDRTWHRPHHT